ncbi:SDR family NAD(P)-dependent oxidoreductase [Saccharopolyspora thermophila]|uniref:D-threitol dehydrogenase n=1 Tax=Saccharopolyspora thermophila TaxID=89367 RepID=A0ABP3N6H2_9PSEU
MTGDPRRTAVVSGAAQGIGAATAAQLTRDGWRIAVLDVNGDGAEQRAEQLDAEFPVDGGHLGIRCDVSDEAEVLRATGLVARSSGRINAVVCGAGNLVRAPATELGADVWRRHLDIHLTGSFLLAQSAFEHLRRTGGSVVTIASVAATLGLPRRVAYTAAKTGVVGMTRTLAAEWGPHGIRVNAVAPGYVDTEMVRSGFRAGTLDERALLDRTPLRRLATPKDIAAAIGFLVSPAAGFITGVLLPVDGGLIIDGTVDRPRAP